MRLFKKYYCSQIDIKGIFFNYAITSLPHLEKRDKGGEDASCASERLIAVADGVGGWNEVGVDPALYSNELMRNVLKQYKEGKENTLMGLFSKACKDTKSRGSSTCCICRLKESSSTTTLETLNLGDSGYLIIRPSINLNPSITPSNPAITTSPISELTFNIIFKSEEQQHSFNFPYQVGEGGDNPQSAQINSHQILPYDLVVLATDGLWDNLSPENIIKVIKKTAIADKLQISNLQQVSDEISKITETVSLDRSYASPFSIKSKGLFRGGKHDDITVIVAQVLCQTTKF